MKQNPPLDLLLLLLLIPAQVELFSFGDYFLVILLMLYMVLTVWEPLADLERLPARFGRQRLAFLLRLSLLFLILLITPIAVTGRNIQLRRQAEAGRADLTEAYVQLHDGALQLEMAVDYLRQGANPYAARYDHPLMSLWGPRQIEVNPATEHLIYLPGLLLITIPFQAVASAVLGFYDQRLLYLLAFILVILILPAITEKPTHKLALMVGVGLNPWVSLPVTWGMNDVMILLCLLMSGLLLQKRQPVWAAVPIGLACTMKQSAWLFTPFFLLAVYVTTSPDRRWRQVVVAGALIAALMLLLIGPFALWDLPAFVDDTFAYASGTATSLNFPIHGYTIGRLLVVGGAVGSIEDYYPFWRWQLLLGLPVLGWSLYYLWRQRTVPAMFLAAGFFTFVLGFVSRYFQDNYIGFVATLTLLGLLPTFPQAEQATEPPTPAVASE